LKNCLDPRRMRRLPFLWNHFSPSGSLFRVSVWSARPSCQDFFYPALSGSLLSPKKMSPLARLLTLSPHWSSAFCCHVVCLLFVGIAYSFDTTSSGLHLILIRLGRPFCLPEELAFCWFPLTLSFGRFGCENESLGEGLGSTLIFVWAAGSVKEQFHFPPGN